MKPPRILFVRGGAIGDFINTLPAIGAVRERWPEAHIEILGYPHISALARGPAYADALRSIEARAMAGFFVQSGILDPTLMDYFASFNLVISYLFDPDEIFSGNVRRCGVRQLITGSPRPTDLRAAAHYCKPLEALAIYVEEPQPRLFPRESDQAVAAQFLAPLGDEPIVAVHPGSGSEKKNWPIDKFAAISRWLVDELAVRLLVVTGEADTRITPQLTHALSPRPVTLAQGLTLPQLAAVLERCALFLGNDSGITHLAAAVGTPTVALFGPASFLIWKPHGTRVRVVPFGPADTAAVRQVIEELWKVPRIDR